jgi:uncharacterized membrane protein
MRFHTTHLLGLIVFVAAVLGIIRHPEALWAGIVPLVGGLCVVVPVLATAEFFMSRSTQRADVNWGGTLAAACIAMAGSVIAVVVMAALLAAFG